ncbi:ARM repeat-containing protein [Gonapodya prolifera JEL478]|uniref:ARM repeat-containing protein n=1 Tax=Gonapodya prolifera (strain JEL478) TaxID=1344416 RepID=A0A139APX0_GONPJ|nr:ARM repeat-containing protein [Gonapodya prolifera JEL478]|eukprot:KXS18553.1 ARM repeat-containing protein [Gonapodya prolifera JEL478]
MMSSASSLTLAPPMADLAGKVVAALNTLYHGDKNGKREADLFLEDFQKTPEAWSISAHLLSDPSSSTDVQYFAAQTLRTKIIYDFKPLPQAERSSLRPTLFHFLRAPFPAGVTRQLAVGLADLAVQQREWEDPVGDVVAEFGAAAGTAGAGDDRVGRDGEVLLEWLAALAEEFYDSRIPMEKKELSARQDQVMMKHSGEVLQLLMTFFAKAGNASPLALRVFTCLKAWIYSGDIPLHLIHPPSPLCDLLFDALPSDALFDAAVDALEEIIHRSRDATKHGPLVARIHQKLAELAPRLELDRDDSERMRGYARVFTEAGTSYVKLIAARWEEESQLVECVLRCAAASDTEVAKVTFQFWYELARFAADDPQLRARCAPVYRHLIGAMVGHIHYPRDASGWTAQDRDDFREFRHEMGDVLKDCCVVLGPVEALGVPFQILCRYAGAGADGTPGGATPAPLAADTPWPDVEAPLFALRALGAKVPATEATIMPRIMSMIPHLPNHPKVRYAAVLVIGRYAEWTARNPSFIPWQLTYVCGGFEGADQDLKSAATQSYLFLCESCGEHLVPHIDELSKFYHTVVSTLSSDDRVRLTEAMSNIVAALPLSQQQGRLQDFCLPIARRLHEIAEVGVPQGQEEERAVLIEASDLVDQYNTYVKTATTDPPNPTDPHPGVEVLRQLWPVITTLLAKFGATRLSRALCRLLVGTMRTYRAFLLPLLPEIINRAVALYEATQFPCYLWVCKTAIDVYGVEGSAEGSSMVELFRTVSRTTFVIIQQSKLSDVSDDIEEYFMTATVAIKKLPTAFLPNVDLVLSVFQCGIHCLHSEHPEASLEVLTFFGKLFHQLSPNVIPFPAIVEPVKDALRPQMPAFTGMLVQALLVTLPRDNVREVADLLKAMNEVFPGETLRWVEAMITSIPEGHAVPDEKAEFVSKVATSISENPPRTLQHAVQDFSASYRRRNLSARVRRGTGGDRT